VVGGGYAGLTCLSALHRRRPKADLVLVDPAESHLILTRLHETLRRPLGDFCRPFARLAERLGFAHRRQELQISCDTLGIWQTARRLPLTDGELSFDALVIATGARPRSTPRAPGTIGEEDFKRRGGRHLVDELAAEDDETGPPLTVVGGGATGLQFLFQLKDVLQGHGARRKLRLVHLEDRPLAGLPSACGDYVVKRLEASGIEHLPATRYLGQQKGEIRVANAEDGRPRRLPSRLTFLFPGVVPAPCSLSVNGFGQVLADDEPLQNIFSAGDCARFPEGSYDAMTAQAAVAKGRLVADNILRLADGRTLRPYRARERGYLVSLGYFDAVGWFGTPRRIATGVSAALLKDALELRYDLSLPGEGRE